MSDCVPINKCCNTDIFAYEIQNVVTSWWNVEQTAECPEGYTGSPVTIPAHTYHSYVSQQDADERAYEAAVAALECQEILYWNTEQTAYCPSEDCGDPVTIPAHTYSSTVSVEDADATALAVAESALDCESNPFCANCASAGNWFSEASGLPYSNSGDNVTGFSNLYGNAFTSDGSTINLSTDPVSLASIETVVDGDFTVSLEFKPNNYTSGEIAIGITDQDNAKTLFLGAVNPSISDNLGRAWVDCDAANNGPYGDTVQENTFGVIILIGDWNTMIVQRAGSVITLTVNSIELMSYDYVIAPAGKIVFAANGTGQSWNIKNISVT